MRKYYSRRIFIKKVLKSMFRGSSGLFFAGTILSGCQSDRGSINKKDPLDVKSCSDISNVSDAELKKREGFAYVEQTPIPDSKCENCNLYIPPKEGQSCGGCILFEGPVYKGGYCTYWAPKET